MTRNRGVRMGDLIEGLWVEGSMALRTSGLGVCRLSEGEALEEAVWERERMGSAGEDDYFPYYIP
ncbi:hypothetical protein [Desulfoluna sp.]|uniref:hypothetical protein n=1 Tax=Desulfoluna sp. TaxID=2045199 RepID=UPI002622A525|nr:hypothetical protein [Desulfoluna sp.]